MKSLSYWELVDFANWAEGQLMGAQLQAIWTNGQRHIVLEFFKGETFFFVVDLSPPAPLVGLFKPPLPIKKGGAKPFTLFLNAHGKNSILESLCVKEAEGRCLEMKLKGREGNVVVDWVLIPKSPNATVKASDKKLSWFKPKELPPPVIPELSEYERKGNFWWTFFQENFWSKAGGVKKKSSGDDPQQQIAKKQKAVSQLKAQVELSERDEELWNQLAQVLLQQHSVPPDLLHLYDAALSRGENQDRAFNRIKSLKKKREGALTRVQELEAEIQQIQTHGIPTKGDPSHRLRIEKIKKSGDIKVKRIPFSDYELWIGQSAKDNLAILRKAQPWYFWMHLKDYPGAHGVIACHRGSSVPMDIIQQMSERLAKERLRSKELSSLGRFDVVLAQVRHVRPIKGDKLGRVTYHNPTVYTVTLH